MIILAKFLSQWNFCRLNTSGDTETNSSTAINILSIDGKDNVASVADLFLLLALLPVCFRNRKRYRFDRPGKL
jgi:hypothetical protein